MDVTLRSVAIRATHTLAGRPLRRDTNTSTRHPAFNVEAVPSTWQVHLALDDPLGGANRAAGIAFQHTKTGAVITPDYSKRETLNWKVYDARTGKLEVAHRTDKLTSALSAGARTKPTEIRFTAAWNSDLQEGFSNKTIIPISVAARSVLQSELAFRSAGTGTIGQHELATERAATLAAQGTWTMDEFSHAVRFGVEFSFSLSEPNNEVHGVVLAGMPTKAFLALKDGRQQGVFATAEELTVWAKLVTNTAVEADHVFAVKSKEESLVLAVAKSAACPSGILGELAFHENGDVRRAVAENTAAPGRIRTLAHLNNV